MQSTSARALASAELMNKVVPTRIAGAASTSAHSLPSQTPFAAYATEASGSMPTEKAASVRPTPPICPLAGATLFLFLLLFSLYLGWHPESASETFYAFYRCR